MSAPGPQRVADLLADAARRLAPVTETPRLDAEILLAHALGLRRAKLLARSRDKVHCGDFEALVARRLNAEPIAYITGEWEFFSLLFVIRPPVLVPRPETEHLVETALRHIGTHAADVLDLGTGSGCVAIAIARNAPRSRVIATDIANEALELAAENAVRLGVVLNTRRGDLFDALRPADGPFDVIVSNPPYVEDDEWPRLPPVIRLHEDRRALLGGEDGLDLIRRIVAGAPERLKPGGLLALEIGEKQRDAVAALLEESGFRDIALVDDLAGIPRVARALFTPSPCGRGAG
ncbi:MAG TPA: peptide chain release factor N(5)-glutamine methyltransferase [Candidatus Hydrogenedentes bacterium]|nr:peptide chain release factor N(5)-glutamine methyltransferase [Candidatus Hydrogenedentota bacterium]